MTDLRELLILVLALLILFSLLRAVFVILRRRKGQIRLSIDKSIAQSMELEQAEEDELDELPNGGARPAAARQENGRAGATAGGVVDSVAASAGVDTEENVPVLTDVVAIAPAPAQQQARQRKRKPNWKAEIRGAALPSKAEREADLDIGAVSMTAGERIGAEPAKSATNAKNNGGATPPRPQGTATATATTKPRQRAKTPPPARGSVPPGSGPPRVGFPAGRRCLGVLAGFGGCGCGAMGALLVGERIVSGVRRDFLVLRARACARVRQPGARIYLAPG